MTCYCMTALNFFSSKVARGWDLSKVALAGNIKWQILEGDMIESWCHELRNYDLLDGFSFSHSDQLQKLCVYNIPHRYHLALP